MSNKYPSLSPLTAVSPIDGRYSHKTAQLRDIFSEYGLIRYRIQIEILWLKTLADHPGLPEIPPLDAGSVQYLDAITALFSIEEAEQIKAIEKTTNHDVKAVEYYLRERLQQHSSLKGHLPYLHFACTSEDINNLAHALMLRTAHETIILPGIRSNIGLLAGLAEQYQSLAMISRTHGQLASPSTLGREIALYVHRLARQQDNLEGLSFKGKINGATGNYNAHLVAYPGVDWMQLSKQLVEGLGLAWNPHTTQIESHDYIAEYCDQLALLHTILIDLCRDIWGYIALGYLEQKISAGEVGSSTMPHKINPIDFENAEGNLGLANAMARCLAERLPISRWQRDLTDSTTLRNLGVIIGYHNIAMASLQKGLQGLQANTTRISHDVENAWEVLAEAIQTVMRKHGIVDSYEQLKVLTRGQKMTRQKLHAFIDDLAIPGQDKQQLKALSPQDYTGNARDQVRMILDAGKTSTA